MFSLQQLFGKGDRFFTLLEQSAREAQESVRLLVQILKSPQSNDARQDLVLSRRKEKKIAEQISEELVRAFVTGLEREDIEALSRALYKIPKSVDKFSERYGFAKSHLEGIDFVSEAEFLLKAVEIVARMVDGLRHIEELEKLKALNDQLQVVETEADTLMMEALRDLFSGKHGALKAIVAKDLFDLMGKILDRCKDAGNVILVISLKNS